MRFLDELRERHEGRVADGRALLDRVTQENRDLNGEELREFERIEDDIAAATKRIGELEEIDRRARAASIVPTTPAVDAGGIERVDGGAELTRSAVAVAERLPASDSTRENLVRLLEADRDPMEGLARWALVTGAPEYRGAFEKVFRDPQHGHMQFTGPEVEAWNRAQSLKRAMSLGTDTAGGFLVPTHLDPSIILTNSGSASPMRRLCRTVTIAGPEWNGVTSAGVTMSWDAEAATVSDDSPTIGAKAIATYKGAGFVQASIEVIEDSDITSDVAMLFADARDRLEGAAFATGSGSGQPTGLWTALDANTNVELTATTAATIGLVDLQTTYRSLPVRWRSKATWLMNPLYAAAVQALGTAVSASFTTTASDLPDRLLTKPLVTDDFAPAAVTTTVRDNEIVFGDFSEYLIVNRVGFRVEPVQHVFDPSTARPTGQRGFYCYFRTGGAPLVDTAWRLLQNKTSA